MKSPSSLLITIVALSAITFNSAHAQSAPGVGPNYETRLSAIEDAMRAMNGQIEQLGFSVKRMDQAVQRMQSDYDARLTRLETVVANPPPAPVTVPAAAPVPTSAPTAALPPPADVNGSLGAVKVQDGKVVGGVNNPKAPPLPDTPPDYGLTPQEQYERAFDLLRKADYSEAEHSFRAFIDKNPQDKLIENAKYWYGETLYVQNKYVDAAGAFADAYQQNPKGAKAPDSLLKLGLSLSGMNKIPEACTALLELKSKYPTASANVRSRGDQERAKLKCGAP